MNVVGNSANPQTLAVQLPRRSREIGVQGGTAVSVNKWSRCFVLKMIWTRLKLSVWGMAGIICRACRPRLTCRRTFGP